MGKYIIKDENAIATIGVTKYAAGISVFGAISSFNLILEGIFDTENMSLIGKMVENPQFTVNVNLKKLCNLI